MLSEFDDIESLLLTLCWQCRNFIVFKTFLPENGELVASVPVQATAQQLNVPDPLCRCLVQLSRPAFCPTNSVYAMIISKKKTHNCSLIRNVEYTIYTQNGFIIPIRVFTLG